MIETGTETAGITVAQTLRRNRKITPTTSAMVSIRVNCTSVTEARMLIVRSEITEILMAGGIEASSCGSAALIAATVQITFAPGSRWIPRMMPRCRLTQPISVVSCGPITALPTSDTLIGPPFRNAMI